MSPFTTSIVTLALSLALLPSLTLADDARPLSKADAMVVMDDTTPSPQGRPDHNITCHRTTRRVGIWIESTEPVVLLGGRISRCDIGIVVAPSPGVTHTITHVEVEDTRIALWNRANSTIIYHNHLGLSQYGIVLAGNRAVVDDNVLYANAKDGLTVTGHGNRITRNLINRSGRFGLQVIGTVPQLRKDESLFSLRDDPTDNHIEGNVIHESGDKDLRQWPIRCAAPPRNTFLANRFGTKNAPCLE